jgi:hypothetical protein
MRRMLLLGVRVVLVVIDIPILPLALFLITLGSPLA